MTRYVRPLINMTAVTAVMLMLFSGCQQQKNNRALTKNSTETVVRTHADSLMGEALTAQDDERISALTDSLSAIGELSPIKTDYYRGYVHYLRYEVQPAIECFTRVLAVEDPPSADFDRYINSGVCLLELYSIQLNDEAVLRTAMPLIEKLNTAGGEKYYELKSIYTSIGTCQLRLNREAEAEESFRKASYYTLKLISTDHTNHIDLYNGVATYSNIVASYFNADKKLEAEPWVDLQDSLFNLFKDSPGAFPEDVDNLRADVLFNRALIADAKGEKDKADEYYKEFKTTDYSKSMSGLVGSSEYLAASERYAEAADNLACLDQLLRDNEITIDLDVINDFLLPKLYVNYHAGRKDSALQVAMQIYEAMDTAMVLQKRNETAKLATIYDTEGKERRIAEQQIEISQQRVIGLAVTIVLLTLFFLIFTVLRYRSAKRLAKVMAAQERIESELQIARDIQMSMVPNTFPQVEGLDMYAAMAPAKEVGGDLYDYLLTDDMLYFCLGDVSGKGVPAAMFMAQTTRLFRAIAKQKHAPATIATRINRELTENNEQGMFVTMFIGRLHLSTGKLDYCNAGHNPPVLGGGANNGDFLQMIPNAPIGLWPDLDYEGEEIDTIKGRALFIYTDGLNEAENLRQKQFGDDHLLDILRQTHFDTSQQIIDALAVEVGKHRNGAEPNDDLTMMCIRVV